MGTGLSLGLQATMPLGGKPNANYHKVECLKKLHSQRLIQEEQKLEARFRKWRAVDSSQSGLMALHALHLQALNQLKNFGSQMNFKERGAEVQLANLDFHLNQCLITLQKRQNAQEKQMEFLMDMSALLSPAERPVANR